MGLDPRIGGQFLKAGLGFGGFCFPKDLQAFVHLAGTVGVDFDILKAAERVNKQRIDRFLEKVHQALWVIKGKRVAVLGLAFKANTDDTRFSPALDVAQRLGQRRRRRSRNRSRSHLASQGRPAADHVSRRRLRDAARCRGRPDLHRMGRIPQSRLGEGGQADGAPFGHRRSQYLLATADARTRF